MKNLHYCHPFFSSNRTLFSLSGKTRGYQEHNVRQQYLIKLVGYFTPLLYALTSQPDQSGYWCVSVKLTHSIAAALANRDREDILAPSSISGLLRAAVFRN